MNTTTLSPAITVLFSIAIFILAMVGIGDVDFGRFNQELFPWG